MTLNEQVARAIRDARALPGTNPVARLSDVDRRAATAAIRVVLEALREPTPEMLEAAWQTVRNGPTPQQRMADALAPAEQSHKSKARVRYQAMLATAIRQLGGEGASGG